MEDDGNRDRRKIKACAEWLALCLSIGWPKSELDALEALWWKVHGNK